MAATRSLLLIAALALAPACGGSSSSSIDPVDDTVADGQATGIDLADQSDDELFGNDYLTQLGMTASILASLNDGEIAESDLAVQIVLDGDIAAYANDIIIDHDDANAELDAVVASYGIDYVPSAVADSLAARANTNIAILRSTPPEDIDFQYVDIEVRGHAAAQVLLDRLRNIVGDGAMGDYIDDTMAMVDDHLARGADLLSTFY